MHPLLYEVHTRQWLAGLRCDLRTVPDAELDGLSLRGVTHLWLMGVWPCGPKARQQALASPDLRREFDTSLPGWTEADVYGSPYSIAAYEVAPDLGGDAGLAELRARLAKRGIAVILDFVPNHLGLDHAWIRDRPELFVGQVVPFPESFAAGGRFIAHGKDPYFPAWSDVAQLDYRKQATRTAMQDVLRAVATRCDGVRCDMAMLVLPDIFERTWQHVPIKDRAGDFWPGAIAAVRREHPGFVFLAEAYWDLETRLVAEGFDFAYDKVLADRLVHGHHDQVAVHLAGLGAQTARRAHFLENHDEKRVAPQLRLDEHRAAAAVILGLPGMRFLHDGQLAGLRRFARIQLARRAEEPGDAAVGSMYDTLLAAIHSSAIGRGDGIVLEPRRAWGDNTTADSFVLTQWPGDDADRFDLLVVNLAPYRAQCRAPLRVRSGGIWKLTDRLGDERWLRGGDELVADGLFLDVDAHAVQLFSFERLTS
jgi:hypothetical protein